jgi:hypothetical protein
VPYSTDDDKSYELSVEEFFDEMETMIRELLAGRGYRYLHATFAGGRYVQVMKEPDGTLTGEVISNLYEHEWALTHDDEDELRRLGFNEPAEGPLPNWWYRPRGPRGPADLVNLFVRVVRVVFREQLNDRVEVRFDRSVGPQGQSYEEWLVASRGFFRAETKPEALAEFRAGLNSLHLMINEWK